MRDLSRNWRVGPLTQASAAVSGGHNRCQHGLSWGTPMKKESPSANGVGAVDVSESGTDGDENRSAPPNRADGTAAHGAPDTGRAVPWERAGRGLNRQRRPADVNPQ